MILIRFEKEIDNEQLVEFTLLEEIKGVLTPVSGLLVEHFHDDTVSLTKVFTIKGKRRKGYGTRVIKEAIEYCVKHGKKSICLMLNRDEIYDKNPDSSLMNFYEKLGFREALDYGESEGQTLLVLFLHQVRAKG